MMTSHRWRSVLAAFPLFASVALAQFPAERTLTDSNGRKLEATVLSEGNDGIRVRRKSDGKEFEIALSKISEADRVWLKSLKAEAAPAPVPEIRRKPVVPERREAPVVARGPEMTRSKEILAAQEKAGLVPPPPGWDALATTIRFKDGKEVDGYVYDIQGDRFWYAARDMVQKSAALDVLAPGCRVEIIKWRSRSARGVSPSVELNVGGKQIHAGVVATDDAGVTLLTEAGEFLEGVPLEQLDAGSRKFLDAWTAGAWEPKKTEWVSGARFTAMKPPFENGHALALAGGKWGVVDGVGEFVDPPRFEDVAEIRESGNFKVREGGKWGLMTAGGKLAVPPEWEDVGDVHHGLVPVRSGGKWGYAEEGGKLVIECAWDDAWRFSPVGTAVVTSGGKRGFVNRSGSVIVKPEWDGALMHSAEGIGAVRRGKGWALVDRDGKVLCDPVWNFRWAERRFEFGYISAWPMKGAPGGRVLLGTDGKPDAKPTLREGVCPATQPGPFLGVEASRMKFTLNDAEGNEVTLDEIRAPKGGFAAVRLGKKWGFADRNGLVIAPQWDVVGNFSEGLAAVVNWGEGGRSSDTARWPWQFIDAAGKTVIPAMDTQEMRFSINTREQPWAPKMVNGRISARDARWRQLWIDDKGTILPQNAPEMPATGKPFPKMEGKPAQLGLVGTDGNVIFKPELEEIRTGSSHWIGIRKNGKWGLADRAGNIVVEPFTTTKTGHPVKFAENGTAIIGIGTRERIYWPDGTQLQGAADQQLLYKDVYGPDLVLTRGENEAREWWVARREPLGLWKLEGARRVYWNASLAGHGRIWIEDAASKRWHFCSIDGKRLGPEMGGQPEQWFFDGGMGIIREGKAAHFIGKDGQIAGVGTWEDARIFRNGMAAAKQGGLWGFIDGSGKIRIECKYDEVGDFFIASNKAGEKGPLLAAASQGGRWGYIDAEGTAVIPFEHDAQGTWQYGKICFTAPEKRWEITAAYGSDGKRYEGDVRRDFYDAYRAMRAEEARHRHAGEWTVTRGDDGMRGLVSDAGKVALENEWRVIVWVAPGVAAVRSRSAGGLFSPDKGWLFREDDSQRILRDDDGGFDRRFLRDGLIMIEKPPLWGYARYAK